MLVKQVPGVKGIYKGIYNEKQKIPHCRNNSKLKYSNCRKETVFIPHNTN